MDINTDLVTQLFEKIEKTAEEILCDQQEIIALDKRRNANREALRQLKDNPICKHSQNFVCIGNTFIRLPTSQIVSNIEKDQEKLDSGINDLRNGLRTKIDHLNTLEGKPLTRGSGLSALSKDEWDSMKQVLG